MRVAVLGGGNGAYAAAADLTEQGHEVRFWRRNAAALPATITLQDAAGEREIRLAQTCAEMGEAVRGAELVFMPDPAFTQPDNARRFLGRYGNPFVAVGADPRGRAAVEWGVYGVPETFVVGRNGRIVYKLIGPITPSNLEQTLKPEIEKALKAPSS